jgi:hypothetical protein
MIPLLAVLILAAVAAPLGFLLLLRKTVRHVLIVSQTAWLVDRSLMHPNRTSGDRGSNPLPTMCDLLVGICGLLRGRQQYRRPSRPRWELVELDGLAPLRVVALRPGDPIRENGLEAKEAIGEDRCCRGGNFVMAEI